MTEGVDERDRERDGGSEVWNAANWHKNELDIGL